MYIRERQSEIRGNRASQAQRISANPWFALVPGNLWVYEGDGETIEVEVTGDTKLIDGITCIVVIDTATEDDVVVETTNDWYAQDVDGNSILLSSALQIEKYLFIKELYHDRSRV